MIKEKKVYHAASISKNSSKTMATDAMGPVHVSDVSRQ